MGLTGCTDHLTDHLTLETHPSLLTGEHTYGDEETDGNRTFSEVNILTFSHAPECILSFSISSMPENVISLPHSRFHQRPRTCFLIFNLSVQGEGDTSRATDPESALSPKKKKKGLRTPSFLKKKKKDKKEKDEKKKEKTPA